MERSVSRNGDNGSYAGFQRVARGLQAYVAQIVSLPIFQAEASHRAAKNGSDK